ncbi:MAG: DUF5690 family protein [Planctomycetota bacterium]
MSMNDSATQPDPGNVPLSRLAAWIDRQPRVVLTIYAMTAAFLAYMSMYAFRKPWSADKYEAQAEVTLFGVAFGYKVVAAIAQLAGYMGSKFLGIKFASEASMRQRVPIVIGLILFAECMLLGFALVPAPYNILFLVLNGLPLGMVWSMLFGIVEGRKITEFLALGMSVSVIFSSAWVKDVGRWTMSELGTEVFWMPFVTGAIFIPVLALSMFMLWHVPPPTAEDIEARTDREPMTRTERRAFIRKYFIGVLALVMGYTMLMGYRNVRDDFMPDILADLGHKLYSDEQVAALSALDEVDVASESLVALGYTAEQSAFLADPISVLRNGGSEIAYASSHDGIFENLAGVADAESLVAVGYSEEQAAFLEDPQSGMDTLEYKTVSFGSMENWVGVAVIALLCLLWFFKNNRHAVYANLAFITVGSLLVGATTLMVSNKIIDPKMFYILNGIGLYMAFVPYQSIFMDRILASLHTVATASFLIALGDAYGYLTVLSTYLGKDIYPAFTGGTLDWAQLLSIGAYIVLVGVPICVAVMIGYFNKHLKN